MKTDNDEFLQVQTDDSVQQLSLIFDVSVMSAQLKRSRPVNPEFEKFLLELRQEAVEILTIANTMSDTKFQSQRDIPTELLARAVTEYNHRHNIVRIEVKRTVKPAAQVKPYVPWSNERKHANRIRRLYTRMAKRWKIPELRFIALLDECAKNPQYFGLCLLPNAADSCPCRYDSAATIAARQREAMFRETGQI